MAEVKVNIAAFNRFLNQQVQPYLMKKAEEIAQEARINAPVGATGDLRSSINVKRGAKGSVTVNVDADHAGYVHQGTGPQANPPQAPYFPRVRRRGLILWSDSKGLNPYQVAHGIAANGTPANPFLEQAIQKVLSGFKFRWIKRDLET